MTRVVSGNPDDWVELRDDGVLVDQNNWITVEYHGDDISEVRSLGYVVVGVVVVRISNTPEGKLALNTVRSALIQKAVIVFVSWLAG